MASTILCVDDNVLALSARHGVLERAGYKVVSARTASMARRLFASRHFDLVITDHYLGHSITGDELAGQLKKLNPETPILWFSASAEDPTHPEYVDGVVHKTDRLADLFNEIDRLLRQP